MLSHSSDHSPKRTLIFFNSGNVRAVELFELSAAQSNEAALSNLGVMYQHGWGVDQDINEAIRYFTQAAERGHKVGQYNLGGIYMEGEGVPVDPDKAIKWLTKAAQQGE